MKLQSSSEVLGRLPFLPLLFLPPPAPGPMLIKTLMFVRVIVLLYLNIEQGPGRGIFSKRENSLFSELNGLLLSCTTFPTTFVCDCRSETMERRQKLNGKQNITVTFNDSPHHVRQSGFQNPGNLQNPGNFFFCQQVPAEVLSAPLA